MDTSDTYPRLRAIISRDTGLGYGYISPDFTWAQVDCGAWEKSEIGRQAASEFQVVIDPGKWTATRTLQEAVDYINTLRSEEK